MSGALKSFFNTSGIMSGASNPTLDIIQIGTPSSLTTDLIPMYQYYEYGWTAWIIDQASIAKAGDIQAIEFALDGPSQTTNSLQKQRIYMGHTTMSAFPSSGVQEDLVTTYGVTNYQRVFGPGTGSTITYSVAKAQPAWNLVNLGAGTGVSQFTYNNTDNLIIQYFNDQYPNYISVGDTQDFYYNTNTNASAYLYWYSSQPSSATRSSLNPVIKLHVFG